jgi:hypothetical protein
VSGGDCCACHHSIDEHTGDGCTLVGCRCITAAAALRSDLARLRLAVAARERLDGHARRALLRSALDAVDERLRAVAAGALGDEELHRLREHVRTLVTELVR